MPVRAGHLVEHRKDELVGHKFMEEITHRIDEHHARPSPTQRLPEALGMEDHVHRCIGGGPWPGTPAKAQAQRFRVAVCASR